MSNEKLALVYAAIDEGQYDKAIRLCGRKDIERYDITKSLLSYCLHKTHRNSEALQVARQVALRKPQDETVLSTLALTLRALKADGDLTAIYENAFEMNPNNEHLGVDLFLCYTRLLETKKMQLLAQRLYKLTSNSKFVYWSVASMLFSFTSSSTEGTLLMLAERMIQKVIASSNEQLGAEELQLYINVLQKQGKHLEALQNFDELISRPAGAPIDQEDVFKEYPSTVKIHSLSRLEMRVNLLEKLELFDELKADVLQIIDKHPDQWSASTRYVDIILKQSSDDHVKCMTELSTHLQFLLVQQKDHPKLRGPYLSELYLLESICEAYSSVPVIDLPLPTTWPSADGPEDLRLPTSLSIAPSIGEYLKTQLFTDIIQKLSAYVKRFSQKPCCFGDVKSKIEFIASNASPEHANLLLEALSLWSQGQSESVLLTLTALIEANSIESAARSQLVEMMCTFNTLQYIIIFSDHCRKPSAAAGATVRFTTEFYCRLYFKTKPLLSGSVGGVREVQPGDELLRLAALQGKFLSPVMTTEDTKSKEFISAIKCAHLLNMGRVNSPHNYAFNLQILDELRSLTVGDPALVAFKKLDVKHIQLDSMSYLIIPALLECGFFSDAKKHLTAVVSFHNNAQRDTLEMVARCFQFNNYLKAIELRTFASRLERSITLTVCCIEYSLLNIVESGHLMVETEGYLQELMMGAKSESQEFLSDEQLSILIDNADYDILIPVDTTRSVSEAAAVTRRQQLLQRIEIGQLVLKLLFCATKGNLSGIRDTKAALECVVTTRLLSAVSVDDGGASTSILWSQRRESGGDSFEAKIYGTFFAAVDLVLYYHSCTIPEEGALKQLAEVFSSCLLELYDILSLSPGTQNQRHLSKMVDKSSGKLGVKPISPQWIKKMSFFTYSFASWAPFILGTVMCAITSKERKEKKKSKGKKETVDDPLQHFKASCISLIDLLKTCCDVLKAYEVQNTKVASDQLETVLAALGFAPVKGDDNDIEDEMNRSRKELISKISFSHTLSCSYLCALLSNKAATLSSVLN